MQKKKISLKEQAVWFMLIGLIIVFSLTVPNFASPGNIITILRQVSNIGILAVGMTFVLISGGIDLSIGNLMGLVGVVTALMMVNFNMSPLLACLIGVLVGVVSGLINGALITYTKMPPLIATLGMSYALRGLAYIVTGGYPVYGLPDGIKKLGQGYLFEVIPICVLIMLFIIIVGAFIMNKTNIGRQFYAIGSNAEAARLSGLNVNRTRVLAYVIAGFLAAISGIVMMSRVNSGQPLSGNAMEMDALIACVVGGISVTGGEGKATGMIGGMLVMGVLANGMAVAGMSEYVQMLVKGVVLVAVVAIDCFSKNYSVKKALKL
ncbi:MAG: ABC transporter permease [Oscillospiraceae bacterium]